MVIDEPEQEPLYDWMQLIKMFLENQPPSDDNAEVECIARKSKQYHIIDDILFHQGANDMMMKCISREEDIQLLRDIHNGICGSHSSWRSIIGKTFRHELCTIICYDSFGNANSKDYALQKLDCYLLCDVYYRVCLHPLGECLNSYEEKSITSWSLG
jgi:hypothetical protein